MQKLPDYFHVHFRREGVMHKIHELASASLESPYDEAGKTDNPVKDMNKVVIDEEMNEAGLQEGLPNHSPPTRYSIIHVQQL